MRVELRTKEKSEKVEEHVVGIEEVIVEVKINVIMAILEAKIKLVEEVENVGSWNVVGWSKALAKLIGKPVNSIQDRVEKKKRKEEEKKKKKEEMKKTKETKVTWVVMIKPWFRSDQV